MTPEQIADKIRAVAYRLPSPREYRKARKTIVSLVGAGGPVGAAIADPNVGTITAAVVAVVTALGVYHVPNEKARP